MDTSIKDLTSGFNTEIESIKDNLGAKDINPLNDVKESIDDLTGPIKRQL